MQDSNTWMTPPHVLALVKQVLGDYYDPCPANRPPGFDSLVADWPDDKPVYVNRLHGSLVGWSRKFFSWWQRQLQLGHKPQAIWLIKYRCTAGYTALNQGFDRMCIPTTDMWLIDFEACQARRTSGVRVLYFGDFVDRFTDVFSDLGRVVR